MGGTRRGRPRADLGDGAMHKMLGEIRYRAVDRIGRGERRACRGAITALNREARPSPGIRTQLLLFLDDLAPSPFGKLLLAR
jgi:hypothetical protein